MYRLPTPDSAAAFAERAGGTVAIKTGRHVYTEWDPILEHRGAHHPALNPYNLSENAECRKTYTADMCQTSLDILATTVFLTTHPDSTQDEVTAKIDRIRAAAVEFQPA